MSVDKPWLAAFANKRRDVIEQHKCAHVALHRAVWMQDNFMLVIDATSPELALSFENNAPTEDMYYEAVFHTINKVNDLAHNQGIVAHLFLNAKDFEAIIRLKPDNFIHNLSEVKPS